MGLEELKLIIEAVGGVADDGWWLVVLWIAKGYFVSLCWLSAASVAGLVIYKIVRCIQDEESLTRWCLKQGPRLERGGWLDQLDQNAQVRQSIKRVFKAGLEAERGD